jgi:hypothetical protein
MWERKISSSGAVQAKLPSGPTIYPSSDAPIE